MTPDDFPNHSSYMTYVTMCEKALEKELKKDLRDSTYYELYEVSNTFTKEGLIYTIYGGVILARHHTSPIFSLKSDDPGMCCSCVLCSPETYYGGSSEEAHKIWLEDTKSDYDAHYRLYFTDDGLPVPPYEPDKNGAHP